MTGFHTFRAFDATSFGRRPDPKQRTRGPGGLVSSAGIRRRDQHSDARGKLAKIPHANGCIPKGKTQPKIVKQAHVLSGHNCQMARGNERRVGRASTSIS